MHSQLEKAYRVLEPKAWKCTLFWLHGLGDTSAGFLEYFRHPASPVHAGARVVLLQAPTRPVAVNGDSACTAWFNIFSRSTPQHPQEPTLTYDHADLKESLAELERCVAREVAKCAQETQLGESAVLRRVFVGGFSQGSTVALEFGLSTAREIAGVVCFSGRILPDTEAANKGREGDTGRLSILAWHGAADPMISCAEAKTQYQLKLAGAPDFSFRELKGVGHEATIEELQATTQWMQAHLPP